MMKAEPLPPDASIASTGLGIRYIGEHAYAFSGFVNCPSGSGTANVTALDFSTGSGYIVGTFNWVSTINDNTDVHLDLIFNGESVYRGTGDSIPSFVGDRQFTIIIPPQTDVQFNVGVSAGGSDRNFSFVLSGRVYGATK